LILPDLSNNLPSIESPPIATPPIEPPTIPHTRGKRRVPRKNGKELFS
jgi:hypothetical protein